MNNWFEVKVKYTKQLDNGAFKRVSEPYLLAAMTFTDAEARIYEELGSVIRGEFRVTNIAPKEYHDIFPYDDSDEWFKCKVVYSAHDGDSERKKIVQYFLVGAHTVEEATARLKENLKDLLADFDVPKVELSPIVDVYPVKEVIDGADEEFISISKQKYEGVLGALKSIRNSVNVHPDCEADSEFEDMVSMCDEVIKEADEV